MPNSQRDWRVDGVKVIKSDRLDSNTPQTPGMLRAAAVNAARGSQKIWAGTVIIHPNAKTGAHHHGARAGPRRPADGDRSIKAARPAARR